MLPTHHHKDDAKWIKDQLRKLPHHLTSKAMEAYSGVYLAAINDEPAEHKKENAARFAANSRLRVYVAKVTQYPTTPHSHSPQTDRNE